MTQPFVSEESKQILPDQTTSNGLVTATAGNQMQALMHALATTTGAAPQPSEDAPAAGGVHNPYGLGLAAFEPNTERFIHEVADSHTAGGAGGELAGSYTAAYGDTQAAAQKATADAAVVTAQQEKDAAQAPGTIPVPYSTGGVSNANGKVRTMINAALDLAARKVPYVWGGTSSTGVDCSGLLYYVAKTAGITDWKRYVAQDYGHMGTAVSMKDARAGDVVFYDEGHGAGHVGLYLGGGKMVAAPQTGDVVKVQNVYGTPTSIRRIWNDNSFGTVATPNGGSTYNYNGLAWNVGGALSSHTPSLFPSFSPF